MTTIKHTRLLRREGNEAEHQQSSAETENRDQIDRKQFSSDLCKAFIDVGIPLWKLENESLKKFVKKYTQKTIPNESTLRKYYVDMYYNDTIAKIKANTLNKKLWISVDETIDSLGRQMCNVFVGTLEPEHCEQPSNMYLVTCEPLTATNSTTISQLVNSTLHLLWKDEIKYDDVLLFVTDAAPYMRKAVQRFTSILSEDDSCSVFSPCSPSDRRRSS